MATNTKDLNIKMVVDHSQVDAATKSVDQLDQATKKVDTTTKDFGKGVKIVYDSTGKAIDVVTDSSLRLNRQSSALVNAMANLTAQGKQNTAEFTLLQRRHLELATTIDKTKGASKDLFGTFSLLPGAVGQFAQELQVGVELMKVFSNLTLTGLKTQFQELGRVVKGLFGFGNAKPAETQQPQQQTQQGNAAATQEETQALKEQNKELEKQHENFGANAAAAQKYSEEIKASTKVGGEHFDLVKQGNTVIIDASKGYNTLTEAQIKEAETSRKNIFNDLQKLNITQKTIQESKAFKDAKEGESIIIDKTTGKIQTAAEAEKVLIANTNRATIAAGGLSKALQFVGLTADEAAGAIGILEAALAALGIGVLIAGLVGAYEVLSKVVKEWLGYKEVTDENKASTDSFTESLKAQTDALNDDLKAVDESNKMRQTRAIIEGETQNEILDIQKQAGDDKLSLLITQQTALEKQQDLFRIADIKDHDEFIQKMIALDEYDQKIVLSIQKQTNEQKKKNNDEYNAEAIKLTKDIAQQILNNQAEFLTITQQKDAISTQNRIKELDNLIKLEQESNDTNLANIKKYMDEKYALEHFGLEKSSAEYKQYVHDRDKLLLDLEIQQKNRVVQGQVDMNNLILVSAKQGSQEYYDTKKRIAKEEYDKDYNLALTAGKDKDNKLIEAQVAFDGKIKTINEEKKKQKEDQDNKLIESSISAIKKEYEKSVEERNNKFKLEKDALQKQLQDKVITQDYYNEIIKNKQKELDNDLDKLASDKKVKELTAQKAIDESRIKLLYEGTQQYYDQQRKIEEDNYQLQKEAAKGNATELEKIEKEHADTILTIARAERDGKRALLFDHLDTVANIGASLQKIAGKNKDIAIAGIRIEQAVTTAKIIMNDLAAIRKSYESSPLTFGLPWSAVYAVDMGLGVVAANTSANDAISALNSADASGGGGGDTINRGKNYGDGGMISGPSHNSPQGGVPIMAEGGEAVMTRGAVTMFHPLLSMLNQVGGGTAFTGGAMGQAPYDAPKNNNVVTEAPIIKTYIVENELTTMQERQARLKSLSTL